MKLKSNNEIVESQRIQQGIKTYKLFHEYSSDYQIYIDSVFDPSIVVQYIIQKRFELYGHDIEDNCSLSAMGIANVLCALYGCKSGPTTVDAIELDTCSLEGNVSCSELEKEIPELKRSDADFKVHMEHYNYDNLLHCESLKAQYNP